MAYPFTKVHSAVNWNNVIDNYTHWFWEQNLKQLWTDTEMKPLKDMKVWKNDSLMTPEKRWVYSRALGGLTLLDTKQANVGMPMIAYAVEDEQRKGVLSLMGMMENIHAKSYSTIFTTLMVKEEIDEVFAWVENNRYLQYKAETIESYYMRLFKPKDQLTQKEIYMAMVASVFLESFLFYSGFFYPLYLAGQSPAMMFHSGEIINLILRDESIHGVYIGLLAQEIYSNKLTDVERAEVDAEMYELLQKLMENEVAYTEDIYACINLDAEVKKFLKYNANKALMNLGKPALYQSVVIDPVVENGLSTETKTHDFFSAKGNGYQKGKVEPIEDEDFKFNLDDEFIVAA